MQETHQIVGSIFGEQSEQVLETLINLGK